MCKLTARLAKIMPMQTIEKCMFVDVVSGKSVGRYLEKSGREVMATGKWSMCRVETAHSKRISQERGQ